MSKRIKKLKQKSKTYTFITNPFYLIILAIFILLYFPTTLWHFPDGIGYYSYMPAVFKYKNYDFYSIMKSYRLNITGVGKKGFIINDFDIGYSLICLPIYLVSTIFGSETVSILFTNFFSSLIGLLSLVVIYNFLTKNLFLEKNHSLFICFSLLLGTPLLFYSYSIPQNPHTVATFLSSIYLYYILSLTETQHTFWNYSLAGILLGVASCVRLQRVILMVPLLIDTVVKIFETKNVKKYLLLTLVFAISFIIGISPQLINSAIQFGTFMPPKMYTISLNKYLFSSIYETLFSSYHSVLLWTPLIFISLFGFIISLKINFLFSIKMLLLFIAEIFTVSLVISPGGGSSFGIRYLTDLVFIFAVGLYFLIKLTPQKVVKIVQIIISLCSLWTFILFALSTSGKIDLLKVYSTKEFFNEILSSIQSMKLSLKPRYMASSDTYLFLTFILIFTVFVVNKFNNVVKNKVGSKTILAITTLYIIIFNVNLYTAGFINRVVYKKEVYETSLIQEDYQKFYTLAGIKVRLKYYNITNQKDKFDYYISLRDKLWPKTQLGKYFATMLFADFTNPS